MQRLVRSLCLPASEQKRTSVWRAWLSLNTISVEASVEDSSLLALGILGVIAIGRLLL